MRITCNDVPGIPAYEIDYANDPLMWAGSAAVDGDATRFSEAPIGSIYIRRLAGSVTFYAKTAHNEADADWVAWLTLAGGTITGDLTVTGTVQAGDVVVTT